MRKPDSPFLVWNAHDDARRTTHGARPMTAYPFLVHLGRFTITGYGLMLMAAFLVAGWVFAKSLEREGMESTIAWDAVVMAVIGGLVGGKVYYALLVHDWSALTSRGGLVWYGGFIGGVTAVSGYMLWKKHSIPVSGTVSTAVFRWEAGKASSPGQGPRALACFCGVFAPVLWFRIPGQPRTASQAKRRCRSAVRASPDLQKPSARPQKLRSPGPPPSVVVADRYG